MKTNGTILNLGFTLALCVLTAFGGGCGGGSGGGQASAGPSAPISYQVYGLNFGPYEDGQDPNQGAVVSADQIERRMRIVAPYTRWIRTFGCTRGLEYAGAIAHRLQLKIAMGAWIGPDRAANEIEMEGLIREALERQRRPRRDRHRGALPGRRVGRGADRLHPALSAGGPERTGDHRRHVHRPARQPPGHGRVRCDPGELLPLLGRGKRERRHRLAARPAPAPGRGGRRERGAGLRDRLAERRHHHRRCRPDPGERGVLLPELRVVGPRRGGRLLLFRGVRRGVEVGL